MTFEPANFNHVFHKVRFYALFLSLLFLILYLTTMPRVNVGYSESDQLIAVAYNLGVAKSPGYPLYLLLLYLVMHLPLKGVSPIFLAHLLSVFMAVITLFLLYLINFQILKYFAAKKFYPRLLKSDLFLNLICFISVSALGVSHLFWLYSVIAEKFALIGLFSVVYLWCLVQIVIRSLKDFNRWFFLAAIILGMSVSHHPVALFLLLPLLFLIAKKTRHHFKIWLLGFLAFVLSWLLPLSLVWLFNRHQALVSWHFPVSIQGWFYHTVITTLRDMVSGFNLNQGLISLVTYIRLTFTGIGWLLVLPLLLFTQRFSSKRLPIDWVLVLSFLSMGVFVPMVFKISSEWDQASPVIGFGYAGHILLIPLIALGLVDLIDRLFAFGEVLGLKIKLSQLLPLCLTPLVIYQFILNYPLTNLKTFNLVSERYGQILDSFSPDSLVTCYTQTSCNALMLEQVVNHKRLDVDIIPIDYQFAGETFMKPGILGFAYPNNPYLMLDAVTWNLGLRRVYAVELTSTYYQLYGIDMPFIYYLPMGYYGELVKTLPKNIPAPPNYSDSLKWLKVPLSDLDPNRSNLQSNLSRDHLLNAQTYLKMDKRDWALLELNLASNLFYRFGLTEKQQIEGIRTNMEQAQPQATFAPGSKVSSADTLLKFIPDLIARNQRSKALKAAQGAVIVDPRSVPARLQLARIYEAMGDPVFVQLEYQNVLKLDPKNTEALNQLEKLHGP